MGFIAQEVQQVIPQVVTKREDGYLAVNYNGFIPVLISGLQEQQKQIEELQEALNSCCSAKNSFMRGSNSPSESSINSSTLTKNKLLQNIPNPYTNQTTIQFVIEDKAENAFLMITDLSGKQLQKLAISREQDSIELSSENFGAGIFNYSLVVDGNLIATKQMVIAK